MYWRPSTTRLDEHGFGEPHATRPGPAEDLDRVASECPRRAFRAERVATSCSNRRELPASWDAVVVGLYGLMVMVRVAFTVLSCESCTCMGKLKVPAWVGVPFRTLLRSGPVESRVRPGGSSLMLLTTNQ